MSLVELLVNAWLALALAFTGVWLLQLRTGNAGEVDAVWAWTLGLLGPWFAWHSTAEPLVRLMIAVMPLVWGVRLGAFLWARNHGKPEDGRYAQLRREWGDQANYKMWRFFQVQVVFSLLIALGLLVASRRDTPVHPGLILLSAGIWVVSILGEALADTQLAAFKRNPDNKGRVCRQGLWA
ncbi:MAG: DUF1295 domain-containing protein, partial [Betaproteobacteria bacterium]